MSEDDSNNDFNPFSNSLTSFNQKTKLESIYSKIKKTLFIILFGLYYILLIIIC